MNQSSQDDRPGAADATPQFGLHYDAWGRLVMIDADGRRHIDVELLRGFPISDPESWISICDAKGREIQCLRSLEGLPEGLAAMIREDLKRREFMPVIHRILSVSTQAEPTEWQVETDRGTTTLLLNSADDIRRLGPFSAIVVDAHGTRYLVKDTRSLDGFGRRVFERYL